MKLHEVIAIVGNVNGQFDKTLNDLRETFTKKRHLFEQKRVSFTSFDEGAPTVVEEQSDIQTTVPKELAWFGEFAARLFDTTYNIHSGNTQAKADIVDDDGNTILKDVPATAMLEMEKILQKMHSLLESAPTLDPALGFSPDPGTGQGVFVARDKTKNRTKKVKEVLLKAAHTDKHPAQTEVIDVDKPIGTIVETHWSAMLRPADKADLLSRCDLLIRAVKRARFRANEVEVQKPIDPPSKALLAFVLGPEIASQIGKVSH